MSGICLSSATPHTPRPRTISAAGLQAADRTDLAVEFVGCASGKYVIVGRLLVSCEPFAITAPEFMVSPSEPERVKRPRLVHRETGTRIASADFAERADKLFGTGETLTELQKLVDRVSLLPWFRNRVEVERKAADIREHKSHQKPSLLHTQIY